MKFTWDEDKNIENQIKHGISFEETVPMLSGIDFEVKYDSEHSTLDEDRFHAIGKIEHHGLVVAVYVELIEGELCRIISAHRA